MQKILFADQRQLNKIKSEPIDIKQENVDHGEFHHEIEIKEELGNAAFRSSEKLCACDFCDRETENGNYLRKHLPVPESAKQFICKFCKHKTTNKCYFLHKKIQRVKKRFRCNDCDFITDRKDDLMSHLNV